MTALLPFRYHDGGREAAGFKGTTDDCVCRAFAIASQRPYREVYDLMTALAKEERPSKRRRRRSSARTGTYRVTYDKVARQLGFEWVPTMFVGSGCQVHLDAALPKGRIVVRVSRHMAAVINHVILDRFDPSRDGTRCVYGYYILGGE